jgi:hypothetical protein
MREIEKEVLLNFLKEIQELIRKAEEEGAIWHKKLEDKIGENWRWFYSMCYYAAIGELVALYRIESLIRKKINMEC